MTAVRPKMLSLLTFALLAGCASSEHMHEGMGLDSGDIAPGAEATLTFAEPGRYELHCHPHPWMEHDVIVQDGGAASATIDVVDTLGNETTFRFEPASVTIAPGGTVLYRNVGNFTHTATQRMGEHGV